MNIFSAPDHAAIQTLLIDNKLPTADLNELDLSCFLGCGTEGAPTGVIGLEIYQQHALLRSLVVASDKRGTGCGQALVTAIEKLASDKGVHRLFLLTETAEHFFSQQGYNVVERQQLPASIKATREFTSLCPQSAIVMTKTLADQPLRAT